jgi:Bacterial lectin/PEP-CTERM motif
MQRLSTSLAALTLAAVLPAAQAQQGVNLTAGPVDYTKWSLFGSAQANNSTPGNGFTYSVLELTRPGSGDQVGAAFAPTALAMDFNQAFRFDFNWYIQSSSPDDLRGDGLTFALTTAPALGGGGSDLGYGGLPSPSVAMAIDTFHFDGEPVSPSLQILADGSNAPLASYETGLGDSIRNADYQWFGSLAYTPSGLDDNAGTLVATIDHLNLGSFSVEATVDFGALGLAGQSVYYGFTASNGLAMDGHATSWGAAVPVPEPQTWLMLLAGLAAVGWMAQRRRVG